MASDKQTVVFAEVLRSMQQSILIGLSALEVGGKPTGMVEEVQEDVGVAGGAADSVVCAVVPGSEGAARESDCESAGSSGVASWADDVNESCDSSEKGPVVPERKFVDVAAAGAVVVPEVGLVVNPGEGFYATVVNGPNVMRMAQMLAARTNVILSKRSRWELALATYTAGTVPVGFENGREKLRMLALVGDTAMSSHFISWAYDQGMTVAQAQERRSHVLSGVALASLPLASGLFSVVAFPPGVEWKSRTGGEVIEALAGVLHRWAVPGTVAMYMRSLGLLRVEKKKRKKESTV